MSGNEHELCGGQDLNEPSSKEGSSRTSIII